MPRMVLRLKMVLGVCGTPWHPVADVVRLIFLGKVHPNKAALQPCLDGPAWKADHQNFIAVHSLDCATPCS